MTFDLPVGLRIMPDRPEDSLGSWHLVIHDIHGKRVKQSRLSFHYPGTFYLESNIAKDIELLANP